jgi:hypothetical protein
VEAAWKECQPCRQKYDTYRLAAATNLAQGNVAGAAKAAMDEFSYMFEGMNIRLTPTDNGVTVWVWGAGSDVTSQRTDLTLPQFNELIVGLESQYDTVLEKSIPVVVQQVAKSSGKPIERRALGQPGQLVQARKPVIQPAAVQSPAVARQTQSVIGRSLDMSKVHDGPRNGGPPPPEPAYNMNTELGIRAQALRIYPWASQSEQRELWIANRMSEQLDREAGNSYSVRVNR